MEETLLDIRDFGAVADGQTDCSAAIQAAVDAARDRGGAVHIPPGTWLCADIQLHPQSGLFGYHSWGFRSNGGSILKLSRPDARCVVNITGAFGATISNLCIEGGDLGENVHGVLLDKDTYNLSEEDAPRIEGCRISHMSGDAVHLNKAWCFSIRHSMLCFSGGHGIYLKGWDGFILDNWLSGNKGWGLYAEEGISNAAVTCTGNRVEWNQAGGFSLKKARLWNITGNYFDRSGGPALSMVECEGRANYCITVTGNIMFRSGADFNGGLADLDNAHIRMDYCYNVVCTSNTMLVGVNDFGTGNLSPRYGIVVSRMRNSIVRDNTLQNACTRQVVMDLGGHGENFVLKDNFGTAVGEEGRPDVNRWD